MEQQTIIARVSEMNDKSVSDKIQIDLEQGGRSRSRDGDYSESITKGATTTEPPETNDVDAVDLDLDFNLPKQTVTLEVDSNSLLNDAIVKHEKNCEDLDLDSTIVMCNVFNSSDKSDDDSPLPRTPQSNESELLITDLDSFSCDIKTDSEKGCIDLTTNLDEDEEGIDLSTSRPDSCGSPQIILLDLQCQEDYITEILNRSASNSRSTEDIGKLNGFEDEENESIFSTDRTEQTQSPQEKYYFSDESMIEMCDEDSNMGHQSGGAYSPNFLREKQCHNDHPSCPTLYHDLNDYEQMKTLAKAENKAAECDSMFYIPESFNQKRDETKIYLNDKVSSYSSKMSVNHQPHTDVCDNCFDFSVNDSGFFDTSHNTSISMEKNSSLEGRTLDLSSSNPNNKILKMSSKCNLSGQYFESAALIHDTPTNSVKMDHSVNPHESHLMGESVLSTPPGPFCFPSNANASINPLYFKQSVNVIDFATPYQQSLQPFTDLPESCSASAYPEWNSWINGTSQDQGRGIIPPPTYITSHVPQPKCLWRGEYKTMVDSESFNNEYLKPDHDSEETDDADEVNGPVIYNAFSNFVGGYEPQWPSRPTTCYNDAMSVSQFSSGSLTPPPSTSNTPSETGSLYSSPPRLSSNISKAARVKSDNSFAPYDLGISKLPYPSMADMMRSSRSSSAKSSGSNIKRLVAESVTSGRLRKNQIQSDAISTSTSKSSRFKRKLTANTSKDNASGTGELSINMDGPEEGEQMNGTRRHNEPLKMHAINIMSQWYEDHLDRPYPTKADKAKMAEIGGVTVTQVKSWFANKRNRTNNTKPKVQKRAMEVKLKELFNDITCNPSIPLAENSRIIEQLSGIIQTCHSQSQPER